MFDIYNNTRWDAQHTQTKRKKGEKELPSGFIVTSQMIEWLRTTKQKKMWET